MQPDEACDAEVEGRDVGFERSDWVIEVRPEERRRVERLELGLQQKKRAGSRNMDGETTAKADTHQVAAMLFGAQLRRRAVLRVVSGSGHGQLERQGRGETDR